MGRQTRPVRYSIFENRCFFDNTHRRYLAEYPLTGNSCATFFLCQIAKTASGSVENQLSYGSPNASRSIFDIQKSLFFRQYSQTIPSGIPADRKLGCNSYSLTNSENGIRIG